MAQGTRYSQLREDIIEALAVGVRDGVLDGNEALLLIEDAVNCLIDDHDVQFRAEALLGTARMLERRAR